jgi:acetoin utilization protein AcuB
MLVKDYMTPNPLTITEDISVINAAEMMKKHHVHRFPILRNNKLVGIVTDRDVRSAGPSQVISFDKAERTLLPELYDLLAGMRVKDIMSKTVYAVDPGKSIVTASLMMLNLKISGLCVLDEQKNLVGILTQGDIFKAMVNLSAGHLGKTLIGLSLEDRPGILKEVADVVRKNKGRIASILSSMSEDKQNRKVYLRLMDSPSVDLKTLKKELEDNYNLLFVIEDDVTIT